MVYRPDGGAPRVFLALDEGTTAELVDLRDGSTRLYPDTPGD